MQAKAAPISFADGLWRSFLTLLVFLLILGAWSYYPVVCYNLLWGWGAVAILLSVLTIWELCHITDWANGVFQSIMSGTYIDIVRVGTVLCCLLMIDLILGSLSVYVGLIAFGDASCTGVNSVTVIFTGMLVIVAVLGELILFSISDLPNDLLDSWVASHANKEPSVPQIEVYRAQKMAHDADRADALKRMAQMRAKNEEKLTGKHLPNPFASPSLGSGEEWSTDFGDEIPTNY